MGDFNIYKITLDCSDGLDHLLHDRVNITRMISKVMLVKAVSKNIALHNYKKYLVDLIGTNVNDDVLTIEKIRNTEY